MGVLLHPTVSAVYVKSQIELADRGARDRRIAMAVRELSELGGATCVVLS